MIDWLLCSSVGFIIGLSGFEIDSWQVWVISILVALKGNIKWNS